jgi:trehalose 2-sulfotransferase
MPASLRSFTDPRLDFSRAVPLRKSYVVASSFRSGSTLLCVKLWETGVLGAPWEYLNFFNEMPLMMSRLKPASPEDYITKLLACRTTSNGAFGVKAHFHDFSSALERYKGLRERLAPISYIYIDRRDKLAQAVSMAKAHQSDSWTSLAAPKREALRYSKQEIARCFEEANRQALSWRRWFGDHGITPALIDYEDLVADPAKVVSTVVDMLGVGGDTPDKVLVPKIEKQSDDMNADWIDRYRREAGAAGRGCREARIAGSNPRLSV